MQLTLLLALLLALGAGCGGTAPNGTEPAATVETTQPRAVTGASIRVGLVTDVGGLDDRSSNFLANEGLRRAREELGAVGRVVVSRSDAGYVPNLSALAQQGYDLVVGIGSPMAQAVETVAGRFP
ncbi:MAG: BMP family ABC transporter substrate-binding protein, partial [Actinomycetota bacterium]|nr:BMP family ABC transporter substrate-binding protein [Actinomycetota bacterium]